MVMLMTIGSAFAEDSKTIYYEDADVNGDKTVDISDIVAVINIIASKPESAGDVNHDGNIDISDIVAIINVIASGAPNRPDTPTPQPSEGKIEITEAKGWQEYAYVKFSLIEGAKSYNAYIKGGQYSDYTRVDGQLVRNYGTYGRADIPGLKAADDYTVKVVAVDSEGTEMPESTAGVSEVMSVKNYDRSGFAHFNYSGVGAYNDDGTLKSGAKVIYLTSKTAKTMEETIETVKDSKTTTIKAKGIQHILTACEKGKPKYPIAIRIIGMLNLADLDSLGSKEEGLQVKGNKADTEMNITIEGIGDDATVKGFGFLVRNCKSVEFRNFAIIRCMDDGLSLDTDNSNIWIHNIDVFYGKAGSGDHVKGDGAIDVKSDSKYVTMSYCHEWDTGKSNMFGMKSESGPNYISYHHNWFDHADSRHPRVRTMSVHVWNNFFDNNAKYGVGATNGSSVFVENNYFLKTKKPILSSRQGTDATGEGTFSGENGGMIKAFGNFIDSECTNFRYYTQNNPHPTLGYDAYETATREDKVPEKEVTLQGGTSYNNFDTDPSLMYTYTPDAAEDVPEIVKGWYGAGRLNHGDIQHTFADNVGNDNLDSEVDKELEAKIDGYKSALVGVFGEEAGETPDNPENPDNPDNPDNPENPDNPDNPDNPTPEMPEGTITCSFSKSGTPSSSFFTVSGKGSDSKGTVTVDGVAYSTCLKMESSTSLKFSLPAAYVMTLYFGPSETASILINGNKINGSGNTYTQTLEAGDYELKKDKVVNLFYIKLVPVETNE